MASENATFAKMLIIDNGENVYEGRVEEPVENRADIDTNALENKKIKYWKSFQCKEKAALHQRWALQGPFLTYAPPPKFKENELSTEAETWLIMMTNLRDRLEAILQLPHHRFWSTVLFKIDCVNMCNSFLVHAPPFYLLDEFPKNEECWEIFQSVHFLVLCIYDRLSKWKESENGYWGKETFAYNIYAYFIFSVKSLLNICRIYGKEYRPAVRRIVTSVMKAQPWYMEYDFPDHVKSFIEILHRIKRKFSVCVKSKEPKNNLTLKGLEELILLTFDVAVTIGSFLYAYHKGSKIFHDYYFEIRIAEFYETVIPQMYENLNLLLSKLPEEERLKKYEYFGNKLGLVKLHLIDAYRLVCRWSLQPAITGDPESKKQFSDIFTSIIIKSMENTHFMQDYQKLFPLETDLSRLCEVSLYVKRKIMYIKEIASRNFIAPELMDHRFTSSYWKPQYTGNHPLYGEEAKALEAVEAVFPHLSYSSLQKWLKCFDYDSEATINALMNDTALKSKNVPKDTKIISMVAKVKDMYPDMDEAFIQGCLEYYEYDIQVFVCAALEDNLPSSEEIHKKTEKLKETRTYEDMLGCLCKDPMLGCLCKDPMLGCLCKDWIVVQDVNINVEF